MTYSLQSSADLMIWNRLMLNKLTIENNRIDSFPIPAGDPEKGFFRLVPN
ncbi:MAG: hypothetical protein ACJAT6_000395 [Akkermansiaceae bacterium]|jgi:hypothetical protein|tara:strand:+ start:48 stop:197 length:150 start_codon:yes stop_codon:yes gene_type:complete